MHISCPLLAEVDFGLLMWWGTHGLGDTENPWETCKGKNAATWDGLWWSSGRVFASGTSDLESFFVVFKIIFFSIISILYEPYSG